MKTSAVDLNKIIGTLIIIASICLGITLVLFLLSCLLVYLNLPIYSFIVFLTYLSISIGVGFVISGLLLSFIKLGLLYRKELYREEYTNNYITSKIKSYNSSYSSKAKSQGKPKPSSNRLMSSSNFSPGFQLQEVLK